MTNGCSSRRSVTGQESSGKGSLSQAMSSARFSGEPNLCANG